MTDTKWVLYLKISFRAPLSQNQSLKYTPSQEFLTDSPKGLWRYKFKYYLLINFNILQYNAWYTRSCLIKCLSFEYKPGKRVPVQSQQLEHVWNMITVNNKDTGTTPLSSFLILNSFYTSFLCSSSLLWTSSSLLGRMISQTEPLKINFFLPFNFPNTKLRSVIRLAEDKTRMGGT